MGMCANDRAEHRCRSRSQPYMSSCGPCWMRGGEVLARAPRSAARARDRVAPVTSSSRSPQSGALPMGMRLHDRVEQRYRSRSQLYTSSSGPRSMRGGEVLTRAPVALGRARVIESRPRRFCHVLSCPELRTRACVTMIGLNIDTERNSNSTSQAQVTSDARL